MASAPQQTQMPLFYKDLMPLNSRDHADWKSKPLDSADFLKGQHAIPLTVDEFVQAQRHYPIVFSSGENPLPLALMGLNEGVNTFVDDKGKINDEVYLPAYVRRYPFMLAKLKPDGEELSLCFDPTVETIGAKVDGEALFDGDAKPTETVQNVLDFCEKFEQAGQRTKAFIDLVKQHELLMDGEISIAQNDDPDKPFVYRGFQMVNQEKLQALSAETLEGMNKSGMIGLLYAHLFSLELMRTIFARQVRQGTAPQKAA